MMKTTGNTLVKALIAWLIFAITGPIQALAEDKHIDLGVRQTTEGYKLFFDNSECPGRPFELGCVKAAHGNSPNISWELDRASRGEWKLVALQFSPDGNNWGAPGVPLNDCTMEDFNLPPADKASGYASTAQVIANGQKMMIKDHNKNQCITHYLVHAENRSTGEKISSHPIIDNRGGN